MTEREFCYWLNGFAELSGEAPPTKAQWKSIREHLALVFTKVTPPLDLSKLGPAVPYRDPFAPVTTPPLTWPPQTIAPANPRPLDIRCSAMGVVGIDDQTRVYC